MTKSACRDEPIFYVYEHWRPDKQACFYVGQGYGWRARELIAGRNKHYRNIVNKLLRLGMSVEIRIVSNNLTKLEACNAERDRILYWRSQGVELVNQTDGGDGAGKGRIVSKETSRKLSVAAAAAWIRPDVREKIIESINTPAAKVKKSISMKTALADPVVRERYRLAAKKRHEKQKELDARL